MDAVTQVVLSAILTLVSLVHVGSVITREFHLLLMQMHFLLVPAASSMGPLRVHFI